LHTLHNHSGEALKVLIEERGVQDAGRQQDGFQIPQIAMTERVIEAKSSLNSGSQGNCYFFAHLWLIKIAQGRQASQTDARRPMTPGSHREREWPARLWHCPCRMGSTQVRPVLLLGREKAAFVAHGQVRRLPKAFFASEAAEGE
jgi:hypothetical protein